MGVKRKEINKNKGVKECSSVISLCSSVLVIESLAGLSDRDADSLPEGYTHTLKHLHISPPPETLLCISVPKVVLSDPCWPKWHKNISYMSWKLLPNTGSAAKGKKKQFPLCPRRNCSFNCLLLDVSIWAYRICMCASSGSPQEKRLQCNRAFISCCYIRRVSSSESQPSVCAKMFWLHLVSSCFSPTFWGLILSFSLSFYKLLLD